MRKTWIVLPTLNRYQHVRVMGARKAGIELGVVEISRLGSYPIPGWRAPEADHMPDVVAVFDDRLAGDVHKSDLRRELPRVLDQKRDEIKALALLGWGNREANIAQAWAINNRIPCILLSDTTGYDRPKRVIGEWFKRRLVATFSSALVSGSVSAKYLQTLNMPAFRTFLGYDVVDNGHFRCLVEARVKVNAAVLNGAALRPSRHFLCVCRLIEIKNLVRMVQSYARCRQLAIAGNSNPWDLVLVGSGPYQPAIETEIDRCGLRHHVHLPGVKNYDEMPTYYSHADAFVLPSISEPWGLVVNEAMANGLPVLVSNRCGCAQDLVQEGVNGYTFDPYDVESLAQLMFRVSAPDFPLSAFGDASRAIIADWGPKRFVSGLQAAVEMALEVGPQRATLLDRFMLKVLMLR